MLFFSNCFFLIFFVAAHLPHENDLALIQPKQVISIRNSQASSLTLNTTLVQDGDFVLVAIDNPDHDARGDWLGMYTVSQNFSETVPLKWTYIVPYLDPAGEYEKSGLANGTFQVYGVRSSIIFRLFSGGTSKPLLVAESEELKFSDMALPLHPRVLAGSAPGEYSVSWSMGAATTSPRLLWGLDPTALNSTVEASEKIVSKDLLCGAPATEKGWLDLGVVASAPLLLANFAGQRVYYALADQSSPSGTGKVYSFSVPPLPGAGGYPFSFTAFGDLGRGSFDDGVTWSEYGQDSRSTSVALALEVSAGKSTFVHHFGDISYAVGYLQTWDEYLFMVEKFSAAAPYLPGVGNHESDWPQSPSFPFYGPAEDSGGECGQVVNALFPPPPPASSSKPWYVFSSGPVTLLVLSSEHDFTEGSEQHAWMATTLGGVNRTKTPFLLVSLHRPMYVDSNYGGTPTSDVTVMNLLQQHVEPLTHASKVSLLLYGHNHRAERISAAFQNKTVLASQVQDFNGVQAHVYSKPTASVHYVAGTGGAAFSKNDCKSVAGPCPPWSESVAFAHGFLHFTALNESALMWEYKDSMDGSVVDTCVLIQDIVRPWV